MTYTYRRLSLGGVIRYAPYRRPTPTPAAQNEVPSMPTTLQTLATIARDALADILTIAHYCETRDARRVADDITEQIRTLQAYARTYAGDPEMGLWSAVRFGYISDTLADELVNVAAGGECPSAVARAFRDTCEALGLDAPEGLEECDS